MFIVINLLVQLKNYGVTTQEHNTG